MNSAKKIYCRTYQTAFRLVLPLLPYRQPALLASVDEIGPVLKDNGVKRVMLITDKSIRALGLTSNLESSLQSENIKCYVYDRTVANPTTRNVEEARIEYTENRCEAIIGFGGGSSMDCAKGLGARIARPGKSLSKMEGILKVTRDIPLLIAIPTTAGTGSETTLAAVITDSKTRHKYPINDFALIPKYAVLDPEVTRTLPRNITSTTGMDALTHAVEAYIGRSTTKDTRECSLEAVRLISGNIFRACENGDDMEARRNMLRASYLAGCAFTKSYVGYVHAVAHSLGGRYNVPHGLANAVLLPFVLEDYGPCVYRKLHELGIAAGVAARSDTYEQGALKFIEAIKDMKKRLDIPDTIAGIREKDIPRLARYADREANPLYPVPKLMDAKELEKFYYMIME